MRIAHGIVAALAGGGLFFAGYEMGRSRVITEQRSGTSDEFVSEQQVQDAMRRWSIKASEPVGRIQQLWSPRSMFIPTRNQGEGLTCIQLRIERGAVGGEPVYCYKDNTTKLVAEYSDVE